MKRSLFALLLILSSFISQSIAFDDNELDQIIMPLGSELDGAYDAFLSSLIEDSTDREIQILILPVAYEPIFEAQLDDVEAKIETACYKLVDGKGDCIIDISPGIDNSTKVDHIRELISDDLHAVLLLSSNSSEAMKILTGSPIEKALSDAAAGGTIIAGASSAGNMLSRAMINGYSSGFSEEQVFEFGAVDIWAGGEQRGLRFGSQNTIIDTQIFQKGRVGRLLNAISNPDLPSIGLGIDAFTSVRISNDLLVENAQGFYTVLILDAETYQSSNGIQYRGENNYLSIRNTLVHLLAPGNHHYNLSTLQHSLAPTIPQIARSNQRIVNTDNTGTLMLSGGLINHLEDNEILQHFVNLSGGVGANILIVADGYSTNRAASAAIQEYQSALGVKSQVINLSPGGSSTPGFPQNISGILLIGDDPSLIHIDRLGDVKSSWTRGIPILAVDAAAAIMGAYYSSLPPTPNSIEDAEAYTQETTLARKAPITQGLGLIDATIEVQVLEDNRWGRLFSLAYHHPNFPALGLNYNTTLVIAPGASTVEGENVLISLDLGKSELAAGTNDGFIIANGLIDIFVPGEVVRYQNADSEKILIHAATPVLPTETPTPVPTNTISPTPTASQTPTPTPLVTNTPKPTRTSRPTRTPLPPPEIPPTTDINLTNAMIVVGVFAVIAVFLGFWINRRQF